MKWVVFGQSVSSAWGNSQATHWRALAAALGRRGVRLIFFERDRPYFARNRDLYELPGGGQLCLYSDWEHALPWARRQLLDADVVLVTSHAADAVAATQLIEEATRPLKVFWDLDPCHTLGELFGGTPPAYLGKGGLSGFDLVLSVTGGNVLSELQRQLGARRAVAAYPCVDPAWHCPAEPTDLYRNDLSFLGSYSVEKHEALASLLLGPARAVPHRRFLVGGPQYPKNFAASQNVHMLRYVTPSEHSAFFGSSRLTLSVTRPELLDMGWCPSVRLFEAAAAGAPILCQGFVGLSDFLEPGREVLLARDQEDVLQAMSLSDHELCRQAIDARERVLEEHSADRRAAQLIALCGVQPGAAAHPFALELDRVLARRSN